MPTHCYSNADLLNCGRQDGLRHTGEGLAVEREGQSGIYVSRIYDSGREGTQWNQLCLDIGKGVLLQVYVWLFDRMEESEEGLCQEDVRQWFTGKKASAQYHSEYRNVLLFGHGRGRYARIAIEILSGSETGAVFRGYDLSFPKESFTQYLPAVYQNHIQLERYLAVLQNIYLELEEEVDKLPERLDHALCSRRQAVRLAGWLGWGELAWQVEKDTLRKLLQTGTALTGKKGTCAYYVGMAEILTGQKAVMIEEPEKCRAVVFILEQPENGRERHLEWLRKNVPIGIEIDFIILHKTDRLDGQYFLDRTSCLSEYESELTESGCPIENLRLSDSLE